MRVLVVDNYDSFVYNLVQYLAQLGADPVVRRNDVVELDVVAGASVRFCEIPTSGVAPTIADARMRFRRSDRIGRSP